MAVFVTVSLVGMVVILVRVSVGVLHAAHGSTRELTDLPVRGDHGVRGFKTTTSVRLHGRLDNSWRSKHGKNSANTASSGASPKVRSRPSTRPSTRSTDCTWR